MYVFLTLLAVLVVIAAISVLNTQRPRTCHILCNHTPSSKGVCVQDSRAWYVVNFERQLCPSFLRPTDLFSPPCIYWTPGEDQWWLYDVGPCRRKLTLIGADRCPPYVRGSEFGIRRL
ncbi:hypothetical protein F5879DRAFT_247200 [Lentinula edodes]|nr:hypothetical protein F5879DRAFT_247200 [Lentinula edodes]